MVFCDPFLNGYVTSNWGMKRSRLESPGPWIFLDRCGSSTSMWEKACRLTGMDQTGKALFHAVKRSKGVAGASPFFLNATEIDATFIRKKKQKKHQMSLKLFKKKINSNPCQTNKKSLSLTIPPPKKKSPQKSNRVLKESLNKNSPPTRKFRPENSIAFLASASMSVSQVKNLVLPCRLAELSAWPWDRDRPFPDQPDQRFSKLLLVGDWTNPVEKY